MGAFFVTYFARLAISPVVPLIVADLAVSNTVIGVALSGMWLAYGLSQFPSGILADRFGERRVILLAVGGTTVMSVLLAFAPVFPVFVLAAVLLGLLAGLHYAVATTLLSRTFSDVGTAVGIHTAGGPLAGLVAPTIAAWIGVRYGWRPAIAVSAIVGVPVLLAFAWRVRPTEPRRPDQRMRERFRVGPLVELVTRPELLAPLLVAMAGTYVVQGLMSFLPTFLVEFREYTTATAGVVFSAFFLVRTGAQVVIGRLSDRLSRDAAIALAMGAGCLGTISFVAGPGAVGVAGGVLLAGFGSSFFSAIDSRFMDALGDAERGAGFGLVRTTYTVVGAAGSVGVGLAADLFGWAIAVWILAGLFGLALLIVVIDHGR
ncbi:Sugar phosphate permease [Halopenitus malekzadehii]|uniref:Sugar phosphate permease n=2 Tax=Halopenitus malekzadehii TaxID=1267564 RepID=A0A1H6JZQ6_9EURY|nr:Sugar phosphate permease [Halopenitus malekzadehii]